MPIKRNYNNAHERMSDKAEKAVLPLLEDKFSYELGLRPILSMDYDSENRLCKVHVSFPKVGGRFSVAYHEHRKPISYPGYTQDEMSQLVERVANTIVGAIQDSVITYGTQDVKRYAKQLYAQCIEDEDTFLTWIEQVRIPVTPKNQLLAYYYDNRHNVYELLKDDGYLTPFPAIIYSLSEDEIRDMSDTTLDYIIRVVNNIRKLHQSK